jgi:hypothetical protein
MLRITILEEALVVGDTVLAEHEAVMEEVLASVVIAMLGGQFRKPHNGSIRVVRAEEDAKRRILRFQLSTYPAIVLYLV